MFVYFVLIAKSAKVSKKVKKVAELREGHQLTKKKSCIQDLFFLLLSDFLAKPSVSFSLTSHCKKMQNIATRIPNVLFLLQKNQSSPQQTLGGSSSHRSIISEKLQRKTQTRTANA